MREVGWWCGLFHTFALIVCNKGEDMELYLRDGWYLINPREIRTVKYFQHYYGHEYPPDIEPKNIENKEDLEKIIRIVMYDKTDKDGNRKSNILEIPVKSDDLFNYIYKNLSRKFNLRIRTQKIEEDNIIKLYENGLTKEEITKILHIRFTLVEKIIDNYKSKKNCT